MRKFLDRYDAGKVLAEKLKAYKNNSDVIVLALPRGGVPVAFEVAKALHAPLDIFIVRKLGVPSHEELAMGAIASNDTIVFNEEIVRGLNIPQYEIDQVIKSEKQELERREKAYRGNKKFPNLDNKIIILVDDGIATGATMRAAIKAISQQKIKKLIVAVPVAAYETCLEISKLANELICPLQPENFYAVGAWYDNFNQTEDEEVFNLLKK